MINEHAGKATFAAFPVSDYTGLRHMEDYPVNKRSNCSQAFRSVIQHRYKAMRWVMHDLFNQACPCTLQQPRTHFPATVISAKHCAGIALPDREWDATPASGQ